MPILARHDAPDLHYDLVGHGPPVLFIQGVGVTGDGWLPQVEGLSREFQTLRYDNRGLGRCVPSRGPISIEVMAQDARALMDCVGWDSAHVVGHSMGGVIAQQLALDVPGRVRSLSLLCTFARGRDAARLTPWIFWMSLRTRLGTRPMRRRAMLEMLWPPAALDGLDTAALAARVGALVGRDLANNPPILLRQLRALARHDASGRLGALAGLPTGVLSAEHDRIAQPDSGRRLSELIPGARFQLLSAVSHGVTLHQPELVNGWLREFLSAEERGWTQRRLIAAKP
ncbi:MAG: hypothetical protein RL514_2162 [Verrucomicrobiota bacterium]|jgi:pimeloyl-ACP methyl ester carboxylesterase